MEFLAPPWLLPVILAPGLWLAWRLYFAHSAAGRTRSAPPAGRVTLALLTIAVWILLAGAIVGPRFAPRAPAWHPPRVVLALDDSRSHVITGARAASVPSLEAARAHYEAQGFEVVVVRFAETVSAGVGPSVVAETREDTADALTSLEALRRHIAGRDDGQHHPNLQAVLLWSDGRFHDDDDTLSSPVWPAPVFPVSVPVSWGDAQGERAVIDLAEPAAPRLEIAWRALGDEVDGVQVLLRRGDTTLWSESFARSPGLRAGTLETSRASLPTSLRQRVPGDGVIVLVRPESAAGAVRFAANDTVPLEIRGEEGARHVLVRPLTTLDERGLVDALATGNNVVAVSADALAPRRGDVIWVNARPLARASAVRMVAARAGVPVVTYHISAGDAAALGAKSPESEAARNILQARLAWQREGDDFMPSGALTLGDITGPIILGSLGLDTKDTVPPRSLAWAEARGTRLPLFWHAAGTGYGIRLPPLWAAGFNSGTEVSGGATSAAAWVRALGAWAGTQGVVRVHLPASVWAGRPFTVTARLPDTGAAVFSHAYGTHSFSPAASQASLRRADSIVLPAGRHHVAVHAGHDSTGALVWSGVVRVRRVHDGETARLGVNEEGLVALATRTAGAVVHFEDSPSGVIVWPDLPRAQVRAAPSSPRILMSPFVAACLIGIVLVFVWWLRRRLRFD